MSGLGLFGSLVWQYTGVGLVLGGGPSVPDGLRALRGLGVQPAAVFSANEHGHKQDAFPVDWSVCLDPKHGETGRKMDEVLGPYGAPIISPCHFGDYRLCDWPGGANTGLTAVALALALGHAPVIAIGIDFYRWNDPRAPAYWHDPSAYSRSLTKRPKNFEKQLAALERMVGPRAPIRALSGPLVERWGRFDPTEHVRRQAEPPEFAARQRDLERLVIENGPRPFPMALGMVEPGRQVAVSREEARRFVQSYPCRVVEPADDPLTLVRRKGRKARLV